MKKLMNRLMGISLLSLLLITGVAQKAQAQDVEVSYQTFYDNLAPYGQWVYDPQYGNVWVPNEGGDFRPYGSRGHWAMTDYGNTWVSEDPWGWAVYHYGRWTYDPYYGWLWIPGYEWAPAWVSWRYGGGYSGWAPMGPGVTVGMRYNYPDSWWIFVAPQYMYVPNCYSYWRGPQYNVTYIRQTTIINNYYEDNRTRVRYNYGPRRDVIERDTRQPVQVYRVSQTNRPGAPSMNGNRVNMYRPRVNQATATTARPSNVVQAPRQVGRPQAANNVSANNQPPFRQQVQRQNNSGQREQAPANTPGTRQQPGNATQNAGGQRNSPANRVPRENRQPNLEQQQRNTNVQPADRGQRENRQQNVEQQRQTQEQPQRQQLQQQQQQRQVEQQQQQQQVQQQRQAEQQRQQQQVQQQRQQQVQQQRQVEQQQRQQQQVQQQQQQQRFQPAPQQQRPAPPQQQQRPAQSPQQQGGRR